MTITMTRRQFGEELFTMAAAATAAGAAADAAAHWDTGRLAVPGGQVLWRASGGGSQPALLMVHGGAGASGKPHELLGSLGTSRRLVTWDQLGGGESDNPSDPANWRLARFVQEMDVVRNALAPGPVHLFGGSWGSTLIMEWLVTKRPANVRSVVFMCPAMDMARTEDSRQRALSSLSPASRQAFEDLAGTGDTSNPALVAATAEYVRTFVIRRPRPEYPYPPQNQALLRGMAPDMRGWSRVAELKTLDMPVLFMRGEYDFLTEEDVAAYVAACPNAESVTIRDAGHLAFMDQPEATVAALQRFFDTVERRPKG